MPVKNEEEAYEKTIDMSNNNDYTTRFCLFQKNYRSIAIDLSKQTKLKDPQQINFIGKLSRNTGEQCFPLQKNQKKLLLIFYKILPQSYK